MAQWDEVGVSLEVGRTAARVIPSAQSLMSSKRVSRDAAPAEEEPEAYVASDGEELEFEDPFEDEFESEDEEESGDEGMEGDPSGADGLAAASAPEEDAPEGRALDADAVARMIAEDEAQSEAKRVWRPGVDQLAPGETLEVSSEAYVMLHAMSPQWPCLSFDVVPDKLGVGRTKYPLTSFVVAGTQADKPSNNRICVMKVHDLAKTQYDDGTCAAAVPCRPRARVRRGGRGWFGFLFSDSEGDDDSDDDVDPALDVKTVPHRGDINRIRVRELRACASRVRRMNA